MLPLYDNIRRRRIELGISQQELADILGYTSRSTIAKIEAGKIDLPQSKIVAFANALKISPGTLMGWTESQNKALWRYLYTSKRDTLELNVPHSNNSDANSPSPALIDESSLSYQHANPNQTETWTVYNYEGEGTHTINIKPETIDKLRKLLQVAGDLPPEKIDSLINVAENMK